jgi:hypothetical protein
MNYYCYYCYYYKPGELSRHSDWLRVEGQGTESPWGRDFSHASRPALGPTQPPVQWVPGLSRRYSGRGVMLTTHPFWCRGYERVELYLYPPSWPVQASNGSALPLHLLFITRDGIV